MTDSSFLNLVLFLQSAPTPFAVPVIAAVVLGFLAGSLLTAIFFLMTRRREGTASRTENHVNTPTSGKRVNIKHCPQCDSTYTDDELSYCLRDGNLLSIVGTMPAPNDPEETRVINRNR